MKSYFIAVFLLLIVFQNGLAQNIFPEKGIYDGMIGTDKLVLVAETDQAAALKGYYVLNSGKAVENSHSFSLSNSGGRPFFQSDLYVGRMKKSNSGKSYIDGTLTL